MRKTATLWLMFWFLAVALFLSVARWHSQEEINYCKNVLAYHQIVITAEETEARLKRIQEDLSSLNQRILKEFYEKANQSWSDIDWLKYNECKEWKHWCDKPDPIPKKVEKPTDIRWLIDHYIAIYWIQHSASTVHRIAECESEYKTCAKFPRWKSQDCSVWHTVVRNWSSASWVFQFTNATRFEWSPRAWRSGASKYNAEANIETAMLMMSKWMRERRECFSE